MQQESGASRPVYRFGRVEVHPHRREILVDGAPARIGDRAFDVLLVLIEAQGQLVTKEALMQRVWPGVVVEEINLSVQISALRKVLDRDRDALKTISGRGYRFVGDMEAAEAPSAGRTAPGPAHALTNLPLPTSDLIGREKELQEIIELVTQRRLVTLTGAGGIGKTRLGLEAARLLSARFPDGVWLAELAPLTDPGLVPAAVATALGVSIASGSESPERVAAALGSRNILLVLDNCEHVVDAAARMAEAFLRGSPSVTVIATSREPLRAEGESIYQVPSLDVPGEGDASPEEILGHGSVRLFIARARAMEPQFSMDTRLAALAAICRHLDGIPLAIELAAARSTVFGVEGLAARLDDRFRLLSGGHRTALPRHQTLRATLDWSYELLPESERIVLGRMAIFAGSCSLQSLCDVVAGGRIVADDVVDYVANLVAKSLVVANVASENGQYRLLETMRAYAMEKLQESGELETYAERHARHYLGLMQRAAAERDAGPTADWLAEHGLHLGNTRAALDWAFSGQGDAQAGIGLTVAAVPLWTHLSLMDECRRRVEQALAVPAAQRDERSDMKLHAALGGALLYTRGPLPEIASHWTRALELADALEETDYRQRALWGLWVDGLTNGDFPRSLDFARRFSRQAANAADMAVGDRMAGISLLYLGELAQSRAHIERMLDAYVAPEHGAHVTRFQFDQRVMARMTLSQILWLQGFPEQAMQTVEANIAGAREIGHALSLCNALGQSACPVALLTGNHDAAERYLNLLLDTMSRHALGNWHGFSQGFRGVMLIKRGDVAAGSQVLRKALEEFPRTAWAVRYTAFCWDSEFADALSQAGDIAPAMQAIDEALVRSERTAERWCIAELLRTRGELLLRGGGAGIEAERLFRQGVDWAAKQGALSLELRCVVSLARLMQSRGQAAAGRRLVEPVYGRFTEGFAMPDLQAAQRILEAG